ncbi:23S rRNA (uracil(1939)-C(5))-methyltransferase RlmD [Clostridium sp. Cult1]|uniref:23S rRNA (uracil(1939)-C(5))-methyltransferase RlmD n=1 Tax=Clostridium sp. Cult1 TaxID=2079002 RepID=UPI001F00008C|nr:23S rRNA (uracil(1939)-C(5))-methyltransferase RlmD [Clostridium sp. Cult1]MCF6462427.1 23S rRNA (uracil(1939)-C(5))-methyltransferase RlmD [Clostridium sp. Cult1]
MGQFKIGDKIKLNIIDISNEGMGVGRHEGFTFFVEGGILGDRVFFEIAELKKRYGIGKTLEILEKSPYRIESKCKFFSQCDGCQLQNLDYNKQLELKRNIVENNLKRIGKIENVVVNDTIGMEYPFRYRNKVEFKVGKNYRIGYYKRGTHDIVPVDKSIIQNEIVDDILILIKEYMEKFKVEGYDRKSKKGIIKNLLIRTTKDNKAMVVIVTKSENLPYKKELIEMLTFPDKRVFTFSSDTIVSIYQNVKENDTSVALGAKDIKLYGEDRILDYIGEYKFLISPKSFFQVNPVQTEVLYDKVVEYLDLKGSETVADLYCGIGTISLFISKYAKKVYGVEIIKEAIEDANENKELNGVNNVEFILGRSEDILPKLNKKGIKLDAIVVDPPRKGLDKALIDSIIDANPEKIIYVSCNPATLARDLGYLVKKGYKVLEAQPVDMFPHTVHVECVIEIQKVQSSK